MSEFAYIILNTQLTQYSEIRIIYSMSSEFSVNDLAILSYNLKRSKLTVQISLLQITYSDFHTSRQVN